MCIFSQLCKKGFWSYRFEFLPVDLATVKQQGSNGVACPGCLHWRWRHIQKVLSTHTEQQHGSKNKLSICMLLEKQVQMEKRSQMQERCKQEKKVLKNKKELLILSQLYLKGCKKITKMFLEIQPSLFLMQQLYYCEGRVAGYHAIVVTVDHNGTSAPQVDVFLPPVAHLEPKT